MNILGYLLAGGFAKGYRTQILGVGAALSVVAMWAVGDMSLTDLIAKLPALLGGLGLAALGAKVDDAKAQRRDQAQGQNRLSRIRLEHGPRREMLLPADLLERSCVVHARSFRVRRQ